MSILVGVMAALAAYFCGLFLTYRHRLYIATARDRGKIPEISLDHFHERFRLSESGPTTDAEVTFIGGADSVPAGPTDRESWILSVLAKDARTLFEFGTASGKTAYLMARNSPPDASIITITLPPGGGTDLYQHDEEDSASARRVALQESVDHLLLYAGTMVETKISQLYGDSKRLDVGPYRGVCDLIFVDGAHAYSYVMSDSSKAFDMVSPTGTILWHDYKRKRGAPRDVRRALDEIARTKPLRRLAGTHMVAYRRIWDTDARGPGG